MKKAFFREPEAKEILDNRRVRIVQDDLAKTIWDLPEDTAVVIARNLVPEQFETPRKFLKHGREVNIARFRTLESAISSHITPVELREAAFNSLGDYLNSGYTIRPNWGDRRLRKISLVECVEGAKLFCYSLQAPFIAGRKPSIIVHPYVDSKRVAKDGGEIVVEVPSRTEGRERYELRFSSVPVVDTRFKWGVAYTIQTDHVCERKRFDIRYKFEDDVEESRVVNFCAHDAAAYFAIIDYFIARKSLIPLQMSQFAIPTQEEADYYGKLGFNVLIKDEDGKPRKLDKAEREILLWGSVMLFGHDRTFYATEKLRDYEWRHVDDVVRAV